MKMKMKMKNNKMFLALVVVAALAMVSVAGVAVLSDNQSDAGIIVDNNKTIVDADGYEGNLTLAVDSTLEIIGTYSGTITVLNTTNPVDVTNPTASEIRAVITCSDVSGVSFVNGAAGTASTDVVTVSGTTDGTITLTSGLLKLGSGAALTTAFTGTVTTTYGDVTSKNTYGAIVTIVPASGTVAAYLSVSGIVTAATVDSVSMTFADAYNGVTNELLGNDITIAYGTTTATASTVYLSGTLAKIDLDGASAIGTAIGTSATYGIIYNGAFHAATIANGKVTSISGLNGVDVTGLAISDSAALTPGVLGLTGSLIIDADVTVTGMTISADTTVINNGTMIISTASVVDGTAINNGGLLMKAGVSGSGNVINYGTFQTSTTASVLCTAVVSGFYYSSVSSTSITTYYGFATLANAIAAAGTNAIVVGGYAFVNEDATVASTQTLSLSGNMYIDGTANVIVNGAFNSLYNSAYTIIIASEASLDVSTATITATNLVSTTIDVNGTLIIKDADTSLLTFSAIHADTSSATTTTITTYTNLYNAITTAVSGDTVTLLQSAVLNKSCTLVAGAKLVNATYSLSIISGVTLTIDGTIQISATSGNFVIAGALIINDTTATNGSFNADTMTLTGTLTIGTDGVFTNTGVITGGTSGAIIVNGTLTTGTGEVTVKTLTVSGTMTNSAVMTVATMTVSGTYTNTTSNVTITTLTVSGKFTATSGTVTVSTKATVTGQLVATTAVEISKVIYIGEASKVLPYINAAIVSGTLSFTAGTSYAVVYGDCEGFTATIASVASTTFYIGDDVYATEYANGITTSVVLLNPSLTGMEFLGWYDAATAGSQVKVSESGKIGVLTGYTELFGYTTVSTYAITLSYQVGVTYVLDGVNVGSSYSGNIAYGEHTLTAQAASGYKGTVTITMTGATLSGGKFTATQDVSATSTGVSKDVVSGGWSISDILLVILVIIIAIIAIVVILKLMRS